MPSICIQHFDAFVDRTGLPVTQAAGIWEKVADKVDFASGDRLPNLEPPAKPWKFQITQLVPEAEGLDIPSSQIAAAVEKEFPGLPEPSREAWTSHCVEFCRRGGKWTKWLAVARKIDLVNDYPPH